MSREPKQFWMVAGDGPSIRRHESFPLAQAEAQRLARKFPGKQYFVLEAIEVIEKREFHTVSFRAKPLDDGIPF